MRRLLKIVTENILRFYKAGIAFLILFIISLFPIESFGDELSIYTTSLGRGDSWTIGSANSGIAIDSGAVGVSRNPAALLINRNEILGEAAIAGGISRKHKVSPDYSFGPGAFYYQTASSWGNFALFYTPENRLNSNAKYPTSAVLARDENVEIGSTLALRVIKDYSTAISIATIRGKSLDGVEQRSIDGDNTFIASGDTIYEPFLWKAKLGIQKRRGDIRWGATLELPAFGQMKIKIPTNDRNVHVSKKYDYLGAMEIRLGIGKIYKSASIETDIQYYNFSMLKVDNKSVAQKDHLLSMGITGQFRINQQIKINSGLRLKAVDPNDRTSILFGLGAKYKWTKDITIFGGAGMLFPIGDDISGSALEDIRPWTLRCGAFFHGM
jgi:hypothetical protein